MSVEESIDYQAVALTKISPHILTKRSIAASLREIGMDITFSWLKRYVLRDGHEYEGVAVIYSNQPPRETLIAFSKWFFANQWFNGQIKIILHPACPGRKKRDLPYIPLLSFRTLDGANSLHLGGKLRLPCVTNLEGISTAPDSRHMHSYSGPWDLIEANYRELYVRMLREPMHTIK